MCICCDGVGAFVCDISMGVLCVVWEYETRRAADFSSDRSPDAKAGVANGREMVVVHRLPENINRPTEPKRFKL